MPKLVRVTTVPMALKLLLRGQMRYMKAAGFEVLMVSADGAERNEVIEYEGCRHELIDMTRQITPIKDAKALWQLYKFFKKERPDIVHSHTPKAGLLAMIAASMAGVKIRVHTVAGLRFMTAKGTTRKILVAMEKLTSRYATHVWPNSYSLLEYIQQHKLAPENKLGIIGSGSTNGINLQRFSATSLQPEKLTEIKKLIQYNPQFIYLLSVGRIVKDKGIDELLKVFSALYENNARLRLILVGAFEEHLDPISAAGKAVLQTHVGIIHVGWHDAVEYFMDLAHLLVHPSHREGFPNVLLQAGAMLCPVVCSHIEGNIDIVEDSQTGLIFEVRNEEDLLRKLEKAIANPELMQIFAKNLRKKIETQFDQRFVQETLKNKYNQLLYNTL